jgi:hypothetical protein
MIKEFLLDFTSVQICIKRLNTLEKKVVGPDLARPG